MALCQTNAKISSASGFSPASPTLALPRCARAARRRFPASGSLWPARRVDRSAAPGLASEGKHSYLVVLPISSVSLSLCLSVCLSFFLSFFLSIYIYVVYLCKHVKYEWNIIPIIIVFMFIIFLLLLFFLFLCLLLVLLLLYIYTSASSTAQGSGASFKDRTL